MSDERTYEGEDPDIERLYLALLPYVAAMTGNAESSGDDEFDAACTYDEEARVLASRLIDTKGGEG